MPPTVFRRHHQTNRIPTMKTIRSNIPALRLIFALAAFATTAPNPAHATSTVGVYDHPTNIPNQVDQSAVVDSYFNAGPANVITVSLFTTQMSNAFNADQGGVFNFDNVAANANLTGVSLSYGTSQTKSLTLGHGSGNLFSAITTLSEAVSGDQMGVKNISALDPDFTFVFSSFANNAGAADLGVTRFGFTFLSQGISNAVLYGSLQATATFSGGGWVTAKATVNNTRSLADTFFGFAAPAGQTITQVTLPVGVTGDAFIEDVGFITMPIPESSPLLLLGMGALVAAHRRRRNHPGKIPQR